MFGAGSELADRWRPGRVLGSRACPFGSSQTLEINSTWLVASAGMAFGGMVLVGTLGPRHPGLSWRISGTSPHSTFSILYLDLPVDEVLLSIPLTALTNPAA